MIAVPSSPTARLVDHRLRLVVVVAAGVTASGEATTAPVVAEPFTLAELEDGAVTRDRFDAFWQAELDRIRIAPCPGLR